MLSLLGASIAQAVAIAPLSGSTFEGNDGNLVYPAEPTDTTAPGDQVDGNGSTDWVNAPNFVKGIDLPSGSLDNAFGHGSNEDDPNVFVVTGSIPPNKNDLTRFYVGSELVSGKNFLYLAWERAVNIGNANMDFEINQVATPGFNETTSGAITLTRTVGDLLVTYDFSGSGNPTLGIRIWNGSAWGAPNTLNATNSEGAVNTQTVDDPIGPNAPRLLTAGLFGEAAINLTDSGVFPPGTCEAFGSTFLKSRSSSSFTAELKDFVAPQAVNISNCGSVLVKKTETGTGTVLGGATFTITPGAVVNGVVATSSTLVDEATAHTGYYCIDNVKLDSGGSLHTVTETVPPPNHDLPATTSQTLSVTNTDTCATRLAATTISPDLTFVDPPSVSAILITKTGKDKSCTGAGTPTATCSADATRLLGGAVFQLKQSGAVKYTSGSTSSTTGTVCIDGVAFGTYTLHELTAPTGYSAGADVSVTFAASSTCAGTPEVTKTVVDQPLTTITVSTTPTVTGTTTSTVQCTGETSASITPHTTGGLVPGTYICTVIIDP
jgi:hypothetical protein